MYLLLELEALHSSITFPPGKYCARRRIEWFVSLLSGAIFQNAKLHVYIRAKYPRRYFSITNLYYTSIRDTIRVLGEKPMCNSTGEISSTYFPITLADLDSNGIENILIVRLHG